MHAITNKVNTVAADVLNHCVAGTSVAMILAMSKVDVIIFTVIEFNETAPGTTRNHVKCKYILILS